MRLFRMFNDNEVKQSIRERKAREEINKEVGEVYLKCKNCEGTGLRFYYWGEKNENTSWSGEYCVICNGTGYVDWVETIIKGTGMVL